MGSQKKIPPKKIGKPKRFRGRVTPKSGNPAPRGKTPTEFPRGKKARPN